MEQYEHASASGLRAMHLCKFCGHLSSREEMSEIAIYSGVIECMKCGQATGLNVTIEDSRETAAGEASSS